MRMSQRRFAFLAAGAVLFLFGSSYAGAQTQASKEGAQVIVTLSDGTILQGMDRREGKYEITGQEVQFFPSGFFFIDEGSRRVFFGSKLLRDVKPRPEVTEEKVDFDRKIAVHPEPVPEVDEVLTVGPWNEKWNRTVQFRSGLHEKKVEQHLSTLTPYFARTDATMRWLWPAVYLTRELGPDEVRQLLSEHPDFQEDRTLAPDVINARRFRYCDFMAEAGWYGEAEKEMTRLLADKPSDKDKARAEAAIAALGKMRCREQFEAVKQAHNAGQFQAVRKRLADFNEKAADDATLTALRNMRDEYAAADKALANAGRLIDDLTAMLSQGNPRDALLVEAASTLRAGLQVDDLPRLEAFLGQAEQAERQRKVNSPAMGPAELLSLAVTGWLLGNPSAEAKPETAVRIWRARQFTLKYLNSDVRGRSALLDSYLKDRDNMATVDEFTQFIPRLPPPAASETTLTDQPVEMKTSAGRNASTYLLQLPPEYRPGRNWPVLFVLHQSGQTPEDMLKLWRKEAGENGYILVAPEWSQGLGGEYGYSDREHDTVLDALRDLRRRFAVDSDRVFLFEYGQGGEMAFDVGLSHPDLFAGVLPMSAGPHKFARRYYTNGQFLPFYIVDGDRSGLEIKKSLRGIFDDWVSQYPMMWVQYKGRGVEFYGAEMPMMFDWMRNKKREFPLQQIGAGVNGVNKDFLTERATDDSFYWLTTNEVQPRCINSETAWRNSILPATLKAHINLDKGEIWAETVGLSQLTIWLGRNSAGESMIDFDKPVTVRWNKDGRLSTPWNKLKVTPSLQTLLEDLSNRGDRQRLYVAKVDLR